jgi:hypothetical protein
MRRTGYHNCIVSIFGTLIKQTMLTTWSKYNMFETANSLKHKLKFCFNLSFGEPFITEHSFTWSLELHGNVYDGNVFYNTELYIYLREF